MASTDPQAAVAGSAVMPYPRAREPSGIAGLGPVLPAQHGETLGFHGIAISIIC